MDPDLALVLGLVLAAFAVPAVMSALADSRAPRASALVILIAGGPIIFALQTRPGGYGWSDVPDAFVQVVARYVNRTVRLRRKPGPA